MTEPGKIHDISTPIAPGGVSWQDAYPIDVHWHSRTDSGQRTTNSTWRLHAHTGTHLDAPLHHLPGGAPVDELDPGAGIGPCRVADLAHAPGDIGVAELRALDPRPGERLLLHTTNSRRDLLRAPRFTPDYVGITPDGARYLAECGVALVGVDYLSVEPPDAGAPRTHHILLSAGIAVLEGLLLADVPAGEYTLLFLPLRLSGADAAPGRAVLVEKGPW